MGAQQPHVYAVATPDGRAVKTVDAATTGRILVVDDDRVFGTFLTAALAARGHDCDWAASVGDGVASLYSRRYDLVVVDLRLPDGSGLDFVREATEDGLLIASSAVILTGHDFVEPDDIRVFHKPVDIEPFLDRMGDIVALTKRRQTSRVRPLAPHGGRANDNGPRTKSIKIDLVLYTSAESEKSVRALKAIQSVLKDYRTEQVSFAVRDLSADGGEPPDDPIVFTPTLVKRGPGPRTWIVGNLDQPELLADLLEVSGVERKK